MNFKVPSLAQMELCPVAEGMTPSWSPSWALGRGSEAILPQVGLRRGKEHCQHPELQPDPCSCARGQPGDRDPSSWADRLPWCPWRHSPPEELHTAWGCQHCQETQEGVHRVRRACVHGFQPLGEHPDPQHIPPFIPAALPSFLSSRISSRVLHQAQPGTPPL